MKECYIYLSIWKFIRIFNFRKLKLKILIIINVMY
jgi:hypothetical protein